MLTESHYSTKMDGLQHVHGGLLRNYTRRALIAQDDPFWNESHSAWKITIEHPLYPHDSITPDYWIDKVLDLCEIEVTHSNFGLGFNDLMSMDPSTFLKIENRVHELTRKQTANLSPELKKELTKK